MQLFLRTCSLATVITAALAASSSAAAQGPGSNGSTERISLDSAGLQVADASRDASFSRDGRYVVFESEAGLVHFDGNGDSDIYVFDRQSGDLRIASRAPSGFIGNAASRHPAISGDGRYVVFTTDATNLVAFDTNGASDVLRKDLVSGALIRVSTPLGGVSSASGASLHPSISFDGRFVAFQSAADDLHPLAVNGFYDVLVRDLQLDTFSVASRGKAGPSNGHSYEPAISDDGSIVAFATAASNVTLNDSNGQMDVVARNVFLGGVARCSTAWNGVSGNGASFSAAVSADGRYVAFASEASNLVAGDANGATDVFRRDRTLDVTELVNVSQAGVGSTGAASKPALSADGRVVAFLSSAQDLIAVPTPFVSVYLRDMQQGLTWLGSRPSGPNSTPNSSSNRPALSGDGALLVFDSLATNLDQGDTNGQVDVFVREMLPDPTSYCTSSVTAAGCQPHLVSSGLPRASANSGFVVTCEDAPNNKLGLMFYGFNGRQSVPFGGGTHCVVTPTVRTAPSFSAGNAFPADDCSGAFSIDMNAFAKGLLGVAPAPELVQVGQRVNVQFWGRDPHGLLSTTFLSDALEYVVGP